MERTLLILQAHKLYESAPFLIQSAVLAFSYICFSSLVGLAQAI